MAVNREPLAEGREHLTESGKFQSDKHQWCPAGYIAINTRDPIAQDILFIYANRLRNSDPELGRDLREAVLRAGDGILSKTIFRLGLSARARYPLAKANIRTIGDLVLHTEASLLEVEGIDQFMAMEIGATLGDYNLELIREPEEGDL